MGKQVSLQGCYKQGQPDEGEVEQRANQGLMPPYDRASPVTGLSVCIDHLLSSISVLPQRQFMQACYAALVERQ
jgi:hypothetical protein